MPIYLYETIPASPGGDVQRFEFKQGMTESAFTVHPETGVPIRRIIVGGFAPIGKSRTTETIHLRRPAGE